MGNCGCKNKTSSMGAKVQTLKTPEAITLVNNEKPAYSREEVIAVKDYVNSRNKTEEGRKLLVEFNKKYFGEIIPGYCDQSCLERTRKRLDRATELLNEWDALQKNV